MQSSFNGTSDFLDLNGPVLNTLGSYTISAWVKLASTDKPGTIISQEGGLFSEYTLSVTSDKRFAFTLYTSKGDPGATATATSEAPMGEWVHLVAVRDGLGGAIRLYVNGTLQASQPFSADWNARGHTIIGAARRKAQRADFFTGVVDEVTFYNAALSDAAVRALDS